MECKVCRGTGKIYEANGEDDYGYEPCDNCYCTGVEYVGDIIDMCTMMRRYPFLRGYRVCDGKNSWKLCKFEYNIGFPMSRWGPAHWKSFQCDLPGILDDLEYAVENYRDEVKSKMVKIRGDYESQKN